MKKLFMFTVAALTILSFAVAGCSSNEASSGQSGQGSGNSKDALVYGRAGDSDFLDPARSNTGETFKVTCNIFETLVHFNYKDQGTKVVPGLAKKWTLSNGGKTYTFKLRKGVKFQDGTDFNAKAVVFNFHRWKNGKGQFPFYPSEFNGYGDESVIKNVKAIDPYTVQFNLRQPSAPFLHNLALAAFGIASPSAVKKYGKDFTKHPVGTGPYKLVKWEPNNMIVLEKNKNYWKKGLPKLNRIIFKVIKSNHGRLTALENGEIDLMSGLNPSDIEQVKNNQKLKVYFRPPLNVGYLGMTVTRKPFNQVKVRQAINYAINKKAIVKAFYADKARVAVSPLPKTIDAYYDGLKPYSYNPKKAKELLKEAGYPNGFKMELWAMPIARPYMPDAKKIAQAIQSDLSKVGIKAKIVTYDWATYLAKIHKQQADAFLLGWTDTNGTANDILYTQFSTDSVGGNNGTFYSNKQLDRILKKAQRETDKAKRKELYKKAQIIIHHDAPWVPIVHSTPAFAVGADVANFQPQPTGPYPLSMVQFK